ncbi:hypothetical protein SCLCIDRAFT_934399 [Scleroderma citrinum Foug A]|uniref:Uncharacterized protein n=1 Tax=Scleroderma citrinum Foug A TaxID=1036808 RepID=A0A0C2ZG88_9AGAM|nr:hypothetical protein SCLCIDRAFT_934399 [Scleroderma citrinum Foug A]
MAQRRNEGNSPLEQVHQPIMSYNQQKKATESTNCSMIDIPFVIQVRDTVPTWTHLDGMCSSLWGVLCRGGYQVGPDSIHQENRQMKIPGSHTLVWERASESCVATMNLQRLYYGVLTPLSHGLIFRRKRAIAMFIAMDQNSHERFYLCGCHWNVAKQRRAHTRALLLACLTFRPSSLTQAHSSNRPRRETDQTVLFG